jgi:hypothetical protein
MKELDINVNENKNYLVVQIDGCSGCRDEVISFIDANSSSPNLGYIITGFEPKLISQVIKKKILPNLIIDRKGLFIKNGLSRGFPVLFSYSNEVPENIKTLNALVLTSSLDSLRSVLRENN